MISNSENYEKLFQDALLSIKECENEITQKEEEIEALKDRKQGFIELRDALMKIFGTISDETINKTSDAISDTPPVTIPPEDSKLFVAVETSKGMIQIPADAFKDFDKIFDATVELLRIIKYPMKTPEIVDALSKGGYQSQSAFFSESVRSALRNASKRANSELVWKNNHWQLLEWGAEYNPSIKKTDKQNNRKFGASKWHKPVGDTAEEILKNQENGLHLKEIHKKLADEGITPTIGSLDVALRQDKKNRFELLGKRIYALRKNS